MCRPFGAQPFFSAADPGLALWAIVLPPRWGGRLAALLQLLDPRVPDLDRLVVAAEVLEADVPLARPVLDRRRVLAVVPLHRLVELRQVHVLHRLAVDRRLEAVPLQL